jgi:hypothetical protein
MGRARGDTPLRLGKSVAAYRYAEYMGLPIAVELALVTKGVLKGRETDYHRVRLVNGKPLRHPDGKEYTYFWVPDNALAKPLMTAAAVKSAAKRRRREHPGYDERGFGDDD